MWCVCRWILLGGVIWHAMGLCGTYRSHQEVLSSSDSCGYRSFAEKLYGGNLGATSFDIWYLTDSRLIFNTDLFYDNTEIKCKLGNQLDIWMHMHFCYFLLSRKPIPCIHGVEMVELTTGYEFIFPAFNVIQPFRFICQILNSLVRCINIVHFSFTS